MNEQQQVPSQEAAKPAYEAPCITTYTSEEILAQIGPALTCSPSPDAFY